MVPPKRNLSQELIQEHRPLHEIYRYIQDHSDQPVQPEEIQSMLNLERPNDGIFGFTHNPERCDIGERCQTFAAQLNAESGHILVRHGWVTPRVENGQIIANPQWEEDILRKEVPGTCSALHAVAGDSEAEFVCSEETELTPQVYGVEHLLDVAKYGGEALGAVGLIDLNLSFVLLFISKRNTFPITRFLFRNIRPTGTQTISGMSRFRATSASLLAGGLGMAGGYGLADLLGLDPVHRRDERFAMGATGAFGAQRGLDFFLARRNPATSALQRSAVTADGATMTRASGIGAGIRQFGAGLLTARLVDRLLGPTFGREGSWGRETAYATSFFLPQMYRSAMGSRSLVISGKRGWSIAGRGALYATTAAMATDIIFGLRQSDRESAIYSRAEQIQEQSGDGSLWRSAVGLITPKLVQRYWVDDRYVTEAEGEMRSQARDLSQNASDSLRQLVLTGHGGQNRELAFYQEVDLSWLRQSDTAPTVTRADGTQLPVQMMADHLSSEDIYERRIQNASMPEIIQYLQNQFSGFELTPMDVQEVLGRIALRRVRGTISQMRQLYPNDPDTLAPYFSNNGNLKAGQEDAFLQHLFADVDGPGTQLNGEQILTLRRIALVTQIQRLQGALQESAAGSENVLNSRTRAQLSHDLEIYQGLARQLGLMDEAGRILSPEIRQFASRFNRRPTPQLNIPTRNRQQVFLDMIRQNAE